MTTVTIYYAENDAWPIENDGWQRRWEVGEAHLSASRSHAHYNQYSLTVGVAYDYTVVGGSGKAQDLTEVKDIDWIIQYLILPLEVSILRNTWIINLNLTAYTL
jgi:hypothetical protein